MPTEDIHTTIRAREIVLQGQEMGEDNQGNRGLFQGHLEWRLSEKSPDFQVRSVRRSVCDVGVFITVDTDTVDIGLTHYFPNNMRRKAHGYVVNAYRQKRHRSGVRFATLVTSYPYYERELGRKGASSFWRRLFDAAKQFNNGRNPDIVACNHKRLLAKNIFSDVIISRKRIPGDWEFTIEVTNTPYRKRFLQSDALKTSEAKPINMQID